MVSITIKEHSIHEALEKDGYVVISSFISSKQIQSLGEFYAATVDQSGVSEPFYTTHWSSNADYRRKVNEFVQQELKENLNTYFGTNKCLLGYFLFKGPSSDGGVFMHKDWSLIDENEFVGYTLWIPLVDTTLKNGCFQVVPGSHVKDIKPRGSFIPQEYTDVKEENFMALPIRAGDVIVFDHRLLHASPPNRSNAERLSVGLIIVPECAKVIHYFQQPNTGAIEIFEAGDDFLVKSFYDYKGMESGDYIINIIK